MLSNVYDAEGRVVDQILGDGSHLTVAYLDDTTRRVTNGSGRFIDYRYDLSGLFAGITTGLGNSYNVSYSPAVITGGEGERTISRTDPLNRTVISELNVFNQPIRETDAAGRVFEFTYEPNSQRLASIKDPLGRSVLFEFDERGNAVATINTDGTRVTLTGHPHKAGQVAVDRVL